VFEDNKWVPYKLEDSENVNKLRAEMNLYPIEEDIQFFNNDNNL
jgi:hypothetical protein